MTDAASPLTAAQAAARLGIKVETLYAYVSRGRLTRHRTAAGSLFDPLEIEAFARARRPGTPTTAHGGGSPLMVLDTDIALVEDDELYVRGRPARDLATRHGFEQVAGWLLGSPLEGPPAAAFALEEVDERGIRSLVAALPAGHSSLHRYEAALLWLAASDPLAAETTTDGLVHAGTRSIAGAAAAVSRVDPGEAATIAQRLAHGWAPDADASLARLLDAALVLLVDHDLAVSTLAARAAASARASAYGVIAAGLGAMDSALHGNASVAAVRTIRRMRDGATAHRALGDTVATEPGGLPGFGHFLYTGIDARADVLLTMLREVPDARPTIEAVDALAAEAERVARLRPNVDLALAAIVTAFDLPADAGTALFAIARSAGWIAHAVDEYRRPPLRLRPQGRYVDPAP
ncbi:citrate synthase [Microbacterium sp. SORGH_AS_0888]|uniref:citrate synthase n=1 Tax=Microbacterium sp. SORGH_AS_0888 TaxID=3041791 RepID=UPI0027D827B3|nr:citrate synthase [Microbacterium sp. SORGH_AS_0888]